MYNTNDTWVKSATISCFNIGIPCETITTIKIMKTCMPQEYICLWENYSKFLESKYITETHSP